MIMIACVSALLNNNKLRNSLGHDLGLWRASKSGQDCRLVKQEVDLKKLGPAYSIVHMPRRPIVGKCEGHCTSEYLLFKPLQPSQLL